MGHKGEAEHQCQVGKGLIVLKSDAHPTLSQLVLLCIWECIWGLLHFIIGGLFSAPHTNGEILKTWSKTPARGMV